MRRPSFQFYPGDWQSNSNLRRCTHAEKGVWVDVMCLLHDQEIYGVLRWSLKEIAQAVGCSVSVLKALVSKGVLKGDDKMLSESFIYTPRSGRKNGEPVTLVNTQDGPIWYSSRMVKDEYVRSNAGASTRFGAENKAGSQTVRKPNPDSDRAKLRARVLEKTGGSCYHCSVRLGERWEIDHLMPRSKGGRHTFANLVPSCVACNQDKSDTPPEDWDALRHSPSHRHGEDKDDMKGEDKGDGSSSSSSTSYIPPIPPAVAVGTGGRHSAVTFRAWQKAIRESGEKAIPEDDPVFAYAEQAGISLDLVRLAWVEFRNRYSESDKRYKDWRKVFRNAVRGNWFRLWYATDDGEYALTTQGMQAQRCDERVAT